jgi:biopolymer transport protein ExbD
MRAEARRPRRRTIALTSLIDVIFILLLFFLLSSTFSRFGELSLATATSDTGARNADTAPVFLASRGGRRHGQWRGTDPRYAPPRA